MEIYLADLLIDALKCSLPQRERQIIEMRWGLVDGRRRTLQEIGNVFGVCRERIRQIEKRAFRKLRHPSRLKKLPLHIQQLIR